MAVARVALVVLILGMILGQASAGFYACYAKCYVKCVIRWKRRIKIVPKKFLPCAWKCTKHCIFRANSDGPNLYYGLGCSISKCENVSDNATKYERCIDKYCSADPYKTTKV